MENIVYAYPLAGFLTSEQYLESFDNDRYRNIPTGYANVFT